jgi:hypothetical protein
LLILQKDNKPQPLFRRWEGEKIPRFDRLPHLKHGNTIFWRGEFINERAKGNIAFKTGQTDHPFFDDAPLSRFMASRGKKSGLQKQGYFSNGQDQKNTAIAK